MTDTKFPYEKDASRNWILCGIPVLILTGCIMHYIYEWSGSSVIVGVFAPINESVWEHLKLTFWPVFVWWLIGYFIYNKHDGAFPAKWYVSCAAAQVACPLVILAFFYTYTGAFGIESLVLDIFSLFLGVAAGQLLALHIYKRAELKYYWLYAAVAVLVILAAAFTIFTFVQPHIPIFNL